MSTAMTDEFRKDIEANLADGEPFFHAAVVRGLLAEIDRLKGFDADLRGIICEAIRDGGNSYSRGWAGMVKNWRAHCDERMGAFEAGAVEGHDKQEAFVNPMKAHQAGPSPRPPEQKEPPGLKSEIAMQLDNEDRHMRGIVSGMLEVFDAKVNARTQEMIAEAFKVLTLELETGVLSLVWDGEELRSSRTSCSGIVHSALVKT